MDVVDFPETDRTRLRMLAAVALSPIASLAGAATDPGPPARLAVEGPMPALTGANEWINSPPLDPAALRGKVVLVNIWTYSCINSLRPMPYLRAWAEKYAASGLVVIGVHSPEFEFEKDSANIHDAVVAHHVSFPVAVDSDMVIWRAFDNEYWPALYLVDAQGRIRHHQFGEGLYEQLEKVIQQLLGEAGKTHVPTGTVSPRGVGVEAPAGPAPVTSEETYVGYARASAFASPGGQVRDRAHAYLPALLSRIGLWSMTGDWNVESERASLSGSEGSIAMRFQARDLHMVLGTSQPHKPLKFRVLLDGQPPLANHGADTDAQGYGTIDGPRLYQLVRQVSGKKPRLFEIRFTEPGAQAYVFTFG